MQPIDTGEVADRLVGIALYGPAGRAPDTGGPEVRTLADLAGAYLEATGQSKRVVEVPVPGKAARAFRDGAHTTGFGSAWGTVTWEGFLRERLPLVAKTRVAKA